MSQRNISFWRTVFINELWFSIINQKRYLFDTVTGFVIVYFMFLVVFYGLRFFSADQVDGLKMDAVIVGYIMWMFSINAFTSTSTFILMESQQGTLEQVFMSPAGFHKLLFVRIIAAFLISLIFNSLLFCAAMLTSGHWLDVPWGKVLLLITISIPSVYGLGYIVGGLALRYKKISSAAGVLQFGLIALVGVGGYPFSIYSLLPFSAGASTINLAIVQGQEFPLWWYGLIMANSVFYFIAGVTIFKMFERQAMKLNVLAHY